jgi:cyanophycinase-like exopeptidase
VPRKFLALIVLGVALIAVALCCAVSLVVVLRPPPLKVGVSSRERVAAVGGVVLLHGGGGDARTLALALLNATGKERPRVGVIPTAENNPIETGLAWVRYLEAFGAEAVLLNITVDNCAWASRDTNLVELVRSLDAVFFLGGFPDRYVRCFLPNGVPTPVLSAVWELYLRGGVVAGASGGAVFLSDYGIPRGFDIVFEIIRGFGLPQYKLVVGVHYNLAYAAIISFFEVLSRVPATIGLAIGEDTAVVCRGGRCRVVGPGPVLLLVYEGIENQSYVFTLSYLTEGDEFTLVDGDAEASKGKTLISKGFPPSGYSVDLGVTATSPEDWVLRAIDALVNSSRVQLRLVPLRGGTTAYLVELSRTLETAIYESGITVRRGAINITKYTALRLRVVISRTSIHELNLGELYKFLR